VLFETLNSQRFDCHVSLVMNAVECVSDGMMILKLFMGSRMFNGQDRRNVLLIEGRGSFYESFISISLEPFVYLELSGSKCKDLEQKMVLMTLNKKSCNLLLQD
jgi:hypothetical protein